MHSRRKLVRNNPALTALFSRHRHVSETFTSQSSWLTSPILSISPSVRLEANSRRRTRSGRLSASSSKRCVAKLPPAAILLTQRAANAMSCKNASVRIFLSAAALQAIARNRPACGTRNRSACGESLAGPAPAGKGGATRQKPSNERCVESNFFQTLTLRIARLGTKFAVYQPPC